MISLRSTKTENNSPECCFLNFHRLELLISCWLISRMDVSAPLQRTGSVAGGRAVKVGRQAVARLHLEIAHDY